MIHKVEMYSCNCDNCGDGWGDEIIAYANPELTREAVLDSDWHEEGNKYYCPDCYAFDDKDNLILKQIDYSQDGMS